jgi:hypothetical protein
MKKYIIILANLLIVMSAFAGSGTSAFEFLRTEYSARTAAMGGAFVAMRGDVNGMFHNPAGVADSEGSQVAFNYVNYLLDINGGFVGYSRPMPGLGQLSFAALYMDYGDFDETNQFAEKTGRTYGASDLALAVSLSGELEDYFTYGVTLKYIHSKIDTYTAGAVAYDFGLIYAAPFQDDLYFGLSLLNVGKTVKAYVDTKESLPLDLRFGVSKKLAHLPLVLNVGLNDLTTNEDTITDRLKKFSIGGEFTLSQMLRLRLGYDNYTHDGLDTGTGAGFAGVSLGLGINWAGYRFDYGFSSYGELGAINRIGINATL